MNQTQVRHIHIIISITLNPLARLECHWWEMTWCDKDSTSLIIRHVYTFGESVPDVQVQMFSCKLGCPRTSMTVKHTVVGYSRAAMEQSSCCLIKIIIMLSWLCGKGQPYLKTLSYLYTQPANSSNRKKSLQFVKILLLFYYNIMITCTYTCTWIYAHVITLFHIIITHINYYTCTCMYIYF